MTASDGDDPARRLLSVTTEEFAAMDLAVKIRSRILGEEVYLVSREELAARVPGVAYTPAEIEVLRRMRGELRPHGAERLRKIHEAKRVLGGRLLPETAAEAPNAGEDPHVR